jgi:carbamoyl-phosphate synthase large subunit
MNMNLLVMCVGRRVELIQWLTETIKGNVILCDKDNYAPALYCNNKTFSCSYQNYESIYHICKMEEITHIMTLIDPALQFLAGWKETFDEMGITLIQSPIELLKICYDKELMYHKLKDTVNCVPTCVMKPKTGSGSIGLDFIKQPFIDGAEYNVQLYYDLLSGELIDIFMCQKILMRAGETERALSIWDIDIYNEIRKLDSIGFKGPVDIDIIKSDKVYILDINPRFGGGYQFAHHAGVNFCKYLAVNMAGKENETYESKLDCEPINLYDVGVSYMKYDVIKKVVC